MYTSNLLLSNNLIKFPTNIVRLTYYIGEIEGYSYERLTTRPEFIWIFEEFLRSLTLRPAPNQSIQSPWFWYILPPSVQPRALAHSSKKSHQGHDIIRFIKWSFRHFLVFWLAWWSLLLFRISITGPPTKWQHRDIYASLHYEVLV